MTTSIRISPAVLLNMLLPGRSDIELEGVCLEHEPGFGERLVLHADIPNAPEGDCVLTINTFDTIGGGRAHVLASIDPLKVPTRTPAPIHPRKAIAALMALESFFDRQDEALAAALVGRLRSYVEDGRPAAFGLAGIFAEGGVFTGGVGNGGGVMGENGPEAIVPKTINITYVSERAQASRIAAKLGATAVFPACKCPGAKEREHLPDCPIFEWEAAADPQAKLEAFKAHPDLAPIHEPHCASVVNFDAPCDCDLAKPPCVHVFEASPGDKHAECKSCGSTIAIIWNGDRWFVRDAKARIEPPPGAAITQRETEAIANAIRATDKPPGPR